MYNGPGAGRSYGYSWDKVQMMIILFIHYSFTAVIRVVGVAGAYHGNIWAKILPYEHFCIISIYNNNNNLTI